MSKITSQNLNDGAQTRRQAVAILSSYFGSCPDFRLPKIGRAVVIVPPKYDGLMPENEIGDLERLANENTRLAVIASDAAKIEGEEIKRMGMQIISEKKPAWAQAAIIAELREDESDIYTDYHGSSTVREVIIGWSKHKKDLFPEMRKAAAACGMEELKELGPGCDKHYAYLAWDHDSSDKAKKEASFISGYDEYYYKGQMVHFSMDDKRSPEFSTETELDKWIQGKTTKAGTEYNKSMESFEHREKYSMGSGYYLKNGHADSTGWQVSKNAYPSDAWLAAIAGQPGGYMVPDEKKKPHRGKQMTSEGVGEGKCLADDQPAVTVTLNEEKNGVEIRFSEIPSKETRAALKEQGFRWSKFGQCWYAKQSAEALSFAESLSHPSATDFPVLPPQMRAENEKKPQPSMPEHALTYNTDTWETCKYYVAVNCTDSPAFCSDSLLDATYTSMELNEGQAGMKYRIYEGPALFPPAPANKAENIKGYAAIMADESLKLRYQDQLDAMFQIRFIDTRNALHALGWEGAGRSMRKGNRYELAVDFDAAGAGKNIVGVEFYLDRLDAGGSLDDDWQKCFADNLTLSPAELAAKIDAATTPSPEPDRGEKNPIATNLFCTQAEQDRCEQVTFPEVHRGDQMIFKRKITPLVAELRENGQDHEFYPTTPEIISLVRRYLNKSSDGRVFCSVLDCGAGDGHTLAALTDGKKYGIEKSQILVNKMPPDIFVVGCDFHENSLIDKKVDYVFCNPPYSEYKEWATRIINEANSKEVFLVLPERWKDQPGILAAVEDRKASHQVIGSADFLEADRKARAKVDVIRINLQRKSCYGHNNTPDIDPFELWCEKEFPADCRKSAGPNSADDTFRRRINELVPARGLVPALVELYHAEMDTLQANFKAISGLDRTIFSELGIDFPSITEFLRNRISGLKSKYWQELFSHLEAITSRLTVDSRKKLLETLTANVSVDFTESNIYAVTSWAIKNANKYFDSQLVDVFEGLINKANLVKYKSNQNTWGSDNWRFREELRDGKITHFGLDYRCVLTMHNTFGRPGYYDYPNGLNKSINDKLNDLVTIANNLGFFAKADSFAMSWEPGKPNNFMLNDGKILMSVKAYLNGNIHVKFNQKFLRKLNVEFGRLKGWLRDHRQAAQELNIPEAEAKQFFKTNFVLECSSVKLLAA